MSDLVTVSKYMSYVLRHAPETAGLTMDSAGWAAIGQLLANAPADLGLDLDVLHEVVATSAKQRFAISDDGAMIRANQGHSVAVDLGLEPTKPPDVLYHGTAARFADQILAEGLVPGARQYVHLSADPATARTVGARHGKPVVLRVDAKALYEAGHEFRQAENGVWLADQIPAGSLEGDAFASQPK